MKSALEQAEIAMRKGEVPVGAIIFDSSTKQIISRAHNMVEEINNPLMHAEIIALNEAFKIKKSKYLVDCYIYVTLEPCIMCMNAIIKSRVAKLYYSVRDNKIYGLDERSIHSMNKKLCWEDVLFSNIEIYGNIMEDESRSLLSQFFYGIRNDIDI